MRTKRATGAIKPERKKAWEYFDTSANIDARNALGKDGWELFAVSWSDSYSKAVFHFKRLLTQPKKET